MKIHLNPCQPPFFAKSGHAQTLLAYLIPSNRISSFGEQQNVTLDDGDILVTYQLNGRSSIVVYLFHGLSGSVDSNYMHRTAQLASAMGHTVVSVNLRGCGEGRGLAKKPYHSGRGEDFSKVIEEGKKRFPHHKHLAIGFSLSANALLLLLTGRRGKVLPDLAIAVNAPINLKDCSHKLGKGFNKLYELEFTRACKRDAKAMGNCSIQFPKFMSIRYFDSNYTGPIEGFKDCDEFYEACATYNHLHLIKTPTIIISSKDDPFVNSSHFQETKLSPSIHLHLENYGGHLGYLSKNEIEFGPFKSKRWLDYALWESINALTTENNS